MTSVPIDRVVAESFKALRRGDTVGAVGLIRELGKQAGQDPRSRLLQGMSALLFGQAEAAIRLLESAWFELSGEEQRTATIQLARARTTAGDAEGALRTIDPIADAADAPGPAIAAKAEALLALGRADDGEAFLDACGSPDAGGHDAAVARASLALSTPADHPRLRDREDRAIAALEAHQERVGVPGSVLGELLLCLGELLARRGEDARAAHLFKRSAGLNPNRLDVRPYANTVGSMLQSWTEATLAKSPRVKPTPATDSERPLFIVGMPGGGPELASSLLALSPEVRRTRDAEALSGSIMRARAGTPGAEQPVIVDPSKLTGRQLETAAEAYLARTVADETGVSRVVDAFPLNLHELGVAAMMFPKARFVMVRRGAFDACLSCLLRHRDPRLMFAHDPRTLAVFAGGLRRLEDLWLGLFRGQRLPVRVLEADYAELLRGGEAARALFEFAGVQAPGDDAIGATIAEHARWTGHGVGLETRFAATMPELASSVAQAEIGRV